MKSKSSDMSSPTSPSKAAEKKYVCVQCGAPQKELFMQISGQVIGLATCGECGATVDPYVEYEWLLLFIDLLLHKRQVWHHLLVNRWPHDKRQFSLFFHCLRLTSAVIFLDACVHKILAGWTFAQLGDSKVLPFLFAEWFIYVILMMVVVHTFLYLQSGTSSTLGSSGGKTRIIAGFTLASAWKVGALPLLVWQPSDPTMQILSLQIFCLASQALALQAFLQPTIIQGNSILDKVPTGLPARGLLALLPLVTLRAFWRSRCIPELAWC